MNLVFILNGEDVVIRTGAEKRLIEILRDTFKLMGAKTGCCVGQCGACSVFLNGELVKSCLIPAFKIQNREIITIEGFSQTEEYKDIIHGFTEAGVENCGYCNAGKIITAEALLSRSYKPTRDEVLLAFQGIKCRCTEPESLIRGILASAEQRRRRLHGRSD